MTNYENVMAMRGYLQWRETWVKRMQELGFTRNVAFYMWLTWCEQNGL